MNSERQNTTVSFRLEGKLREFYEQRARIERRRLSDMLRLALEDHAKTLEQEHPQNYQLPKAA